MTSFVWLVVVLSLCLHETQAGFRILGFRRDRMTENSKELLNREYFLTDENLGEGEEWTKLSAHFCWSPERNHRGYCHIYFKTTQQEDVEHYQVVGYKVKQMDVQSKYLYNEKTGGEVETINGVTEQFVASGDAWVGSGYDDWGYQYLYLYLNKTLEPPILQAIQTRTHSAGGSQVFKEAEVQGSTYDATEWEMCDFRKWSEDWWDDTEITLTLWISKTVLKTMSADWDKKELFSTNQGTPNESFKERILVNDRCGNQYVQGQTGELTNGQTYTITETAGWSQSFSFGFSVSYEAGVDIKMISNTMSMTSEMSYESSKDFEKAVTKSETSTYKWPDYCNPGFECKTTLYITRNVYKIPVTFTFERNGETFTTTNYLVDSVETFHDKNWPEVPTGTEC